MARHEADFRAVTETELAPSELRLLGLRSADTASLNREEALARFLSGSEDWPDALKKLGGAFASEPRLKKQKQD